MGTTSIHKGPLIIYTNLKGFFGEIKSKQDTESNVITIKDIIVGYTLPVCITPLISITIYTSNNSKILNCPGKDRI